MKKLIYLFGSLLLGAVLLITSCSKLDTEFEATYDADLEVSGRDMNGEFSAYATIDPADNADFDKNSDKIKNIDIISVSGQVIYISQDVILNAQLSVYSDTRSTKWSFSSFPVTTGSVLTLGNESGQWDTVKQIANEKNIYHVSLVGNTDQDDVSFTVRVTIKYRVTAKAI